MSERTVWSRCLGLQNAKGDILFCDCGTGMRSQGFHHDDWCIANATVVPKPDESIGAFNVRRSLRTWWEAVDKYAAEVEKQMAAMMCDKCKGTGRI